jgi:adenylate cyclase
MTVEKTLGASLQGMIDSFFMSSLLGGYVIFVTRGVLRNVFSNINFTLTVIINSFAFLFFLLGGRLVGGFITHPDVKFWVNSYFSGNFFQWISFALVVSITINFILQMNRLVGQNVLMNFIAGNYHKPRQEDRLFMFLDMESSTKIAEALGNLKFHGLLNRFFYDLTGPVLETDGEIYEYAGDEVLISWKQRKGIDQANCLRCFFLIEKIIYENSNWYMREFGVVPHFRAALHGGNVIAGELGDIKQKIAFVGDALNTTSRILEYCRETKHRFLISGPVIDQVAPMEQLAFEDLGLFHPRGKQESLKVYSVRAKHPQGTFVRKPLTKEPLFSDHRSSPEET